MPSPKPELPAVVLLHGIGGAARVWTAQLQTFHAAGFAAVALDLVGYGARPSVSSMTFEELAAALESSIAERTSLARIRVPVLCLACEKDPNAPPVVMERMAAKIPGAQYVCLPGVGHLPNLEAPAAFDAAILGFLVKLKAQP